MRYVGSVTGNKFLGTSLFFEIGASYALYQIASIVDLYECFNETL